MTGRFKSHKRKNVFFSRGILIILVFFVVIVGRSVWGVYTKERETQQRLDGVRAEHDDLNDRSVFLEGEIERLSTEKGVEEEIRRQYGLAREGERVFIIVDRESEEATTTQTGFWKSLIFWID